MMIKEKLPKMFPKDTKYKHWCGCITEKYRDGVAFAYMCDKHQNNRKYIWIALQHPMKKND